MCYLKLHVFIIRNGFMIWLTDLLRKLYNNPEVDRTDYVLLYKKAEKPESPQEVCTLDVTTPLVQ